MGSVNVGHNHPKVTKAIQDQSSKILQMSNLFYTTPQLPLAKILIENSDLDRVFFVTLEQKPMRSLQGSKKMG